MSPVVDGAGVLLLALACALSIAAVAPPDVVPRSAAAGEFSAERAMDHVRAVARDPHPIGTRAHTEVRRYILDALAELSLAPSVQATSVAARFAGNMASARLFNIVATLRGARSARPALMLAAHYDSVPQSPGASDDASGVATLLETARALKAGPALENDVMFLFTDGEELGLLGAQAFVQEHPLARRVALVMNFDARGSHGAVAMFDTSAESGTLIRQFAAAAPHPTASSFISALAQALPNDTDATVFKKAGMSVLGFAYADGLENYHRRTDSIDTIDAKSVQHDGSYALALARHFGQQDLSALRAPDIVYFDLLSRAVVRYPVRAARIAAFLTIGALAVLLFRARRAGAVALRRIVAGMGWLGGALLLAGALATLTGALIMQLIGFYRAAALDKLFAWQGILLAAALVVSSGGIALRKENARELSVAAMLLWALGLAASAVLAPTVSAELQWPLFFALLASAPWLLRKGREEAARVALVYVGFLPAVVMSSRVIYAVIVATGATAPAVPVVFFVLLAALLAPVWARLEPSRLLRAGALLASASVLIAVIVVTLSRWRGAEPTSDSLVYAVDADRGTAEWVTFDDRIDRWVGASVRNDMTSSPWPMFSRSPALVLRASAPLLPWSGPEVDVVSERRDGGGRALVLRIRAASAARCLRLWQDGGPAILGTRIDGKPLRPIVRFSPETDEKLFRMVTGDRSRSGWHMEHCGLEGVPLELSLDLAGGEPLRLHMVQEIDGLPTPLLPGPARPPDRFPSQESDTTLVGRVVVL